MKFLKLMGLVIVTIAGIVLIFFVVNPRPTPIKYEVVHNKSFKELLDSTNTFESKPWNKEQYENLTTHIRHHKEEKAITRDEAKKIQKNFDLIYIKQLNNEVTQFFNNHCSGSEIVKELTTEINNMATKDTEYANKLQYSISELQTYESLKNFSHRAHFYIRSEKFIPRWSNDFYKDYLGWKNSTALVKNCTSLQNSIDDIPDELNQKHIRSLSEYIQSYESHGALTRKELNNLHDQYDYYIDNDLYGVSKQQRRQMTTDIKTRLENLYDLLPDN